MHDDIRCQKQDFKCMFVLAYLEFCNQCQHKGELFGVDGSLDEGDTEAQLPPRYPKSQRRGRSMDTTCNMFGTAKVMKHGNRHGQWSRKTNSQWLHALGYIEQWSKLVNFPAKFLLLQTTQREKQQHRWTICNIFECMIMAFLESITYFSLFESSLSSTKTPRTTQLLTFVYL